MVLPTGECQTCDATEQKLRPNPFHKSPELLQCENCRASHPEHAIIGVTDVKKQYKLKDDDLSGLKTAKEAKPKFLGGPDKRWYLLKEVEVRAEKVLKERGAELEKKKAEKEEKQKEKEHKQEEKEEKQKYKEEKQKSKVGKTDPAAKKGVKKAESTTVAPDKKGVKKAESTIVAPDKKGPTKRKRATEEVEPADDPEGTEDAGTEEDEVVVPKPKEKRVRATKADAAPSKKKVKAPPKQGSRSSGRNTKPVNYEEARE